MRELILHRERALACFAMPYRGVLDVDRETYLQQLDLLTPEERMEREEACTLRNGETVRVPISESSHTLFVAAVLEQKVLTTGQVDVPQGTEDVKCTVKTDYDGFRHLCLALEKAE